MNKLQVLGVIAMSIFLIAIASCTLEPAATPAPTPAGKPVVTPGQGWEAEWNKRLAAARQEGTLTIRGGSTVTGLQKSSGLFKEKFGIELQLTTVQGALLVPKLEQERKAGLYLLDLIITGQPDLINLKRKDSLDPLPPMLVLPDILDQKLWYDGKFDWADMEGRYIFNFNAFPYHGVYINTDLVKAGEIQSYHDLLDPKWKDKIVINDPTVSGQGSQIFRDMLSNKMVDQDFFRQLVAQNPVITRDQDLQATWVAKGKYPVALWASPGAALRFIEASAPIAPVLDMKEGVVAGSSGSSMVLLNKAPHPNASSVFINWFLSKEGQTINQNATAKQTRRVDVTAEVTDPFGMRKPGVKYLPDPGAKESFYDEEMPRLQAFAEQVFAPLLK